METIEEFQELTVELAKLVDGLTIKKFQDIKDDIHGILEHMSELYNELEIASEEDDEEEKELELDE